MLLAALETPAHDQETLFVPAKWGRWHQQGGAGAPSGLRGRIPQMGLPSWPGPGGREAVGTGYWTEAASLNQLFNFMGCVILDKLLYFTEPQIPYL